MTDIQAFEHDDGILVVDSRLIAERLNLQHESFLRTARKYQTRIEAKFGQFRFQIGTVSNSVGAVNEVIYLFLTEPQAMALMSLSKNTDEVVDCKLELVEAFEKAKALIKQRRLIDATLQIYLLDDPVRWKDRGRVFQEEFYKAIYRLQDWEFTPGKTRHPVKVAHITIDIIYQRLQPGVWDELDRKNPRLNGRRKHCCHQFLTDNIGNPHLRHHLYAVTKMMQGSRSWQEFLYHLDKFHPRTNAVQLDILYELFAHCPDEGDRWKRLAS